MDQSLENYRKKFGTLDYVSQGMLILRDDYIVLFWNTCLEKWTRISSSEICGRDIRDLFLHFKSPPYSDTLNTLFQDGSPAVFSSHIYGSIFPAQLNDGKDRILNTSVSAIPALGDELYCALFNIEDVTSLSLRIAEYKRMKDKAHAEIIQRVKAEQELVNKNETLNSILKNSPVGIVLTEDNTVTWANEAVLNMFGIRTEAEYKEWPVVAFYKDNKEYKRVLKHLGSHAATDVIPPIEVECKKKDGSLFTVQMMITSQNADNNFNNRIAIIVDLTERLKGENDRVIKEKLQASLEMTGTVCHEMNQPIMAISGYSELLLGTVEENDPSYEKIKKINLQSIRAGEITRKLMNLTNYNIEYESKI